MRCFWLWVSALADWFADYGLRDWMTLPRDLAVTFWRDVLRGENCEWRRRDNWWGIND